MGVNDVRLGGVQLDDCQFKWPLFRGALPRMISIRQSADLLPELSGLPRITKLEFDAAAEDGVVDPETETLVIEGVRIVDLVDIDGEVCEITLSDCRRDISRRISDADANILFKDGYLNLTRFERVEEWFEWLFERIPELADNAAPDWNIAVLGELAEDLPDGLVLAGPLLPHAIDSILEFMGADFTVGTDGLWRLATRGTDMSINVNAYSWVNGAEPSWAVQSRTSFDLPAVVRFYYPEKHAIRLSFATVERTFASGYPDELKAELVQVYKTDEGYKSLADMLEFYGYARDAVTDSQIASNFTSENWETTALHRGKTANADTVIDIIRKGWRQTFRVAYVEDVGRSGGWRDWLFGYYEGRDDKEGLNRVTGQISAMAVRCEYTEYLARAEQQNNGDDQTTIENVVVARSRTIQDNGDKLPVAPLRAQWESPEDEVVRIFADLSSGEAQAILPGRMSGGVKQLTTELRDSIVDDDGNLVALPVPMLHVPTVNDIVLDAQIEIVLLAVATRAVPNTIDRWTMIERPFAADNSAPEGGVEAMEVEVSEGLHSLRDYVDSTDQSKWPEADGLGRYLNTDELVQDAARREKVLRDRLTLLVGGDGTAQGVSVANDLSHVHGALNEVRIAVDYPVILTEVDVGNLDNQAGRYERKLKRDAQRVIAHGGKVLV